MLPTTSKVVAADAVGRLLEHRRNRVEDVARNRGDEGQDHQREHQPRGQHAIAERRPLEEKANARDVAKRIDKERLDIALHHRPEVIDAPDAVDDGWNSREELDRDADRSAQGQPAELRQEDRDAEPDRNGDQHGNQRRDKRAVDRGRGAELLLRRAPGVREEEAEAEFAKRRPGAEEQARPRRRARSTKTRIAAANVNKRKPLSESLSRPSARERSIGDAVGGARALQCGCGHRGSSALLLEALGRGDAPSWDASPLVGPLKLISA